MIICAGSIFVDNISKIEKFPKKPIKVLSSGIDRRLGGSAAVSAFTAKKLGFNSKFIGKFGDDDSSIFLRNEFKKFSINIDKSITIKNCQSSQSFVIEDGDGTEVSVTDGKEIKFVEGHGIDINWTDTSDGTDADPYDLTFSLKTDMRINSNTDVYTGNSNDYIHYDTDVGMRFYTAGGEDMRLTDGGDLHVDANIIGYSTTISDQRLKGNINKIENALDKVMQINGYTFTYNHDGKQSAGVIAQEVENIMPSAVQSTNLVFNEDKDVEFKTVQYDQIHGLLIEAIKELKEKLDQCKCKKCECE